MTLSTRDKVKNKMDITPVPKNLQPKEDPYWTNIAHVTRVMKEEVLDDLGI
jgi:hypothetical protein